MVAGRGLHDLLKPRPLLKLGFCFFGFAQMFNTLAHACPFFTL